MKKRVVALLLAVLFIVPMLSGCGGSGGDSIVIYSCLEEFRNDDLKQKLNEKFPDLNIVLQYQSTVSYTHLDVYKRQAPALNVRDGVA